jgi:PIN domain nuclease of toxin-antitoxin system
VRLLLDTHALVWYTHSDPNLTAAARTAIQDGTNEVWISPASYWEIAIKVHLGKWNLNQPYAAFLNIALNQYGFQILPILPDHTIRLIGLPDHHRDPFDRLLVAQATVEGMTLVSSDVVFDQYGVPRIWA